MGVSTFADRLRDVIGASRPAANPELGTGNPEPQALERVLGGQWRDCDGAVCFVVGRRQEPSARYGRDAVGAIANRLANGSAEGALISTGPSAGPPFLFFDLETTGLSGGAGTHAFLVGCGWFDADGGFVSRQYLMTRPADERHLLAAVAAEMAQAGTLVSFNGKSFDAPVLETRYLFHRREWAGAGLPHIDVLHPARRFWSPPCSLIALEQEILGARRREDVPGFEIPGRYFQFVRTGDARPLVDVLEHNRLDLLSLAGLTARLLDLLRVGPDAARDACEALALGAVYGRAGLDARARDAYATAVSAGAGLPFVRIEARRALALLSRRAHRYEEAAGHWQALVDLPDCPPHIVREAAEALAIHHEHRVKDLAAAKAYALRGPEIGAQPRWREAVQYRLARIQKKMSRSEPTVTRRLFLS